MFSSVDQLPTLAAGARPPSPDAPVPGGSSAPGETVDARIQRGPLPAVEALRVTERVLRALEAPHALGIAHGNIAIGTVFLEPSGVVRILDAAGRPGADDTSIDVAAAGALLFAMLAGAPPAAPPGGPENVLALVDRALGTGEGRFTGVRAMLDAIEEARLALIQPSPPPMSPTATLRLPAIDPDMLRAVLLRADGPAGAELPTAAASAPPPPEAVPTAPALPADDGPTVTTAAPPEAAEIPSPISTLRGHPPPAQVLAEVAADVPAPNQRTLRMPAPVAPFPAPAVAAPEARRDPSFNEVAILKPRPYAPLIAVGALVVGAVVALAILMSDGPRRAAQNPAPSTSVAARAADKPSKVTASAAVPRTRAHEPPRAALPNDELLGDDEDDDQAPEPVVARHAPTAQPTVSARPAPTVAARPPASSVAARPLAPAPSARPVLAAPPPVPAAANSSLPAPPARRTKAQATGRTAGGAAPSSPGAARPPAASGDVLDRRE